MQSSTTVKRGIWLKDPETGEDVCRRDYIKELYVHGSKRHEIPAGNRRAIVNHLAAYFDHVVPFQIVFQATAGCDYFIEQSVDTETLDKVKKAAKNVVTEEVKKGSEAQAVLDRIIKK